MECKKKIRLQTDVFDDENYVRNQREREVETLNVISNCR